MSNWMFDMHDLDVDWDGEHVHVNMGVTIVNSVSGLVSESGRNSLLGRNWTMNVEFGYQLIDDFDQGIINFGTAYQF